MKKFMTGLLDSGHSTIYKNAKKDTKSFRVTQKLLNSLWNKSKKINNKGLLILNIPANKIEKYVLKCYLTKEKN